MKYMPTPVSDGRGAEGGCYMREVLGRSAQVVWYTEGGVDEENYYATDWIDELIK